MTNTAGSKPLSEGLSGRPHPLRGILELVVPGIILEISFIVLVAATGLERSSPLLEIFFWLPFAAYLLAIWRVKRGTSTPLSFRYAAGLILLFSLVFHATVLFSSSMLSDDIFRYYWDGKVLAHGINPYIYPPDSGQLFFLRDANWGGVANRDVATMYPPLSQIVFALSYRILPGIFTLRLFSVLFSLLGSLTMLFILRDLRRDARLAIIYAWSPLAVIEFANSGHIDSLAVLGVVLSFLFLLRGKNNLSAAALALAVLAKVYPLLFAPLFLLRWGKKGAAVFAGVLAAFYLPFLITGGAGAAGFNNYARWAQFNASLFALISAAFRIVADRTGALTASKIAVFLAFLFLLAFLMLRFYRSRSDEDRDLRLWRYSFYLTGAFLLLSPAVFPWYLTWVLPFLCFFDSAGWLLFTGTVILSRWVYVGYERTGVWAESGWARLGEYVPVYLLLAKEWLDRTKKAVRING